MESWPARNAKAQLLQVGEFAGKTGYGILLSIKSNNVYLRSISRELKLWMIQHLDQEPLIQL